MSALAQAVVDEARSYMAGRGTRWRHQGRTKFVGVDCIGLIGMSALACQITGAQEWHDTRDFHNYGPIPQEDLVYSGADLFMDRIPIAKAAIGDVLVMSFATHAQHFALVSNLEPMRVVHCYASFPRRVTENGIGMARARVLRAYRFRGIA